MKKIEAIAEKHAKGKHLVKGYTGTYDLETSLQLSAQIENSKQDFIAGYNAANEWVRVEDRLPELGEKVLVYFAPIDNQLMGILAFDMDANKIFGVFYKDAFSFNHGEDITHWMSLPTPPTT